MEEHVQMRMPITIPGRRLRKQLLHEDKETFRNHLKALDENLAVLQQDSVCGYNEDVHGQQRRMQGEHGLEVDEVVLLARRSVLRYYQHVRILKISESCDILCTKVA